MSYKDPKKTDNIKNIKDFITELEQQGKFPKLLKGKKKNSLPLIPYLKNPAELAISSYYQRQFSTTALNSYEQYDPQLVRPIVVSHRPESLGGHFLIIDGQHTCGLAIYSEAVDQIDCLVLEHPEDRTLEECIRVEAKLFHAYNTKRKNPTMIDKYRAGLCFDDPDSVRFQERLEDCSLQVDGMGDTTGDHLSTLSATRFDKCVRQFDNDEVNLGHYITKAVNYIRGTWGTPKKNVTTDDKGNKIVSEFKYRDDLIHGLTTLLVLIDIGKTKRCANLTKQQQEDFADWLENEAHKKTIHQYTHHTGGGNVHFKIAHRFLQEYNTFDQYASISHEFAHANGVWNEEGVGLKTAAKAAWFSEPETRKDKLLAVKEQTYRTADFPKYEK